MSPPTTQSALDRLVERLYPGCRSGQPSPVDGTVAFYRIFFDRLPDHVTLLDFGAGRGAAFTPQRTGAVRNLLQLAPKIARRIGVDVDPVVRQNPELDEVHVLAPEDDYRIPLATASVDAVLADWVLEHLQNPLASLRECRRVLKPSGLFAARTPNRWHYSYLVSRAVGSTQLGKTLLRIAQPHRQTDDVFRKYYRVNTAKVARILLTKAGFSYVQISTHEPEPAYLMFSRATLLLGWVYERLARHGAVPRASLFIFGIA
jgi:SAM-dependent methyltransferase